MRRTVLFLGILVLILGTTAMAWTRTDTLKVTATGNDGRVQSATFSSSPTSAIWGRQDDAAIFTGWWRMQSRIPAGRSITSVVPIVRALATAGTDTSYWRFSKIDSVAAPTDLTTFNAIPLTTDSVRSIGGITWTSGTRYELETLTVAFKETYSQGHCDSGEFVLLRIKGANLGNVNRYRNTYDYGIDPAYAFWLEIVHTDAASTAVKSHRRRVLQIGSLEPQYHEWTQWERIQ